MDERVDMEAFKSRRRDMHAFIRMAEHSRRLYHQERP